MRIARPSSPVAARRPARRSGAPRIGDRLVRSDERLHRPDWHRMADLTGGAQQTPLTLEDTGLQIWLADTADTGAVAFDAVDQHPVTVDFCRSSEVVHRAVIMPGVDRQVVTGAHFDRVEIRTEGTATLRGLCYH